MKKVYSIFLGVALLATISPAQAEYCHEDRVVVRVENKNNGKVIQRRSFQFAEMESSDNGYDRCFDLFTNHDGLNYEFWFQRGGEKFDSAGSLCEALIDRSCDIESREDWTR